MNCVALGFRESQEFESVPEALAVADYGANLHGVRAEWKGNVEGDDFTRRQFPREGGADAILAEFRGTSPAIAEISVLEHADLQAEVDDKARVAATATCWFVWLGLSTWRCHGSVSNDQRPIH
jgi:hypothetical protein